MEAVNDVILNVARTNAKEIDLSNMHLKEFPKEIFLLKQIETIKLMHNQIKEIPYEIINLYNLKHLYLYDNRISFIPEDLLLKMPYLQNFDLAENPLDYNETVLFYQRNNMMFGYRENLQKITSYSDHTPLLKNTLSLYEKARILPNEISELMELERLSIHLKELIQLPKDFCNLTNLKYLDLSHNKFDNLPDDFNKLSNLEYLDLSYNSFKSIPDVIWDLPNLRKLHFNSNGLENFDFSILDSSLSDFSAYNNPFENFNSREFEYYSFSELKDKYNRSHSF